MSSAKRNAVITAIILIIAGLMLCGWVYHRIGGDLSKLNTAHFELKTYEVTEAFKSVDIRDSDFDIDIVLLEDDSVTCRVETAESDGCTSTVKVENGTLKISREDNRKWYENIGNLWNFNKDPEVTTVYLPAVWFESINDSYDGLTVKTISGDVSVPRDLDFKNVDIITDSGDVEMAASVSQDWSVKTASGDVSVKNAGGRNGIVHTVSGEVRVYNTGADKLDIATTSGDVRLQDTSTGSTTINTTSGEVELLGADAREFDITTVSGDVSGTIGTRSFDITTTSGDVDVPNWDTDAYPCRIRTTSGDISLR